MALTIQILCGLGLLIALRSGQVYAHDDSRVAIARETAGIESHPENAAGYLSRALLHLERGDWQACLEDVDRAENHSAGDLGCDFIRGRALAAGQRWPQARAALESHLKGHPSDAAAHIALARVEEALGQVDAAARRYLLAMPLMGHPEPDHYVECADLLCRAGKDDEAIGLLDKAPVLPAIVERATKIEVRQGRFDAALRRTEALLAVSSQKEPVMAKKATILAQAGRNEESIQVWNTIIGSIKAMTPQAQGSHAMSKLLLQSRQAILALSNGASSSSP